MSMIRIVVLAVLCLLLVPDRPARAQSVAGMVTDSSGAGLPGVSVALRALHRGAVTDADGRYRIAGLHSGAFVLEFSLLGYRREARTVHLDAAEERLDVTLSASALELPGVVVTGAPQPTDALSSPQSVSAVSGRDLDRAAGQTVLHALEETPGVTTYTTGVGVAKPVVRGLTSQRVLVLADGTRQEGQQWGDEHGPEIDAFDVERIEVVRGPGSVLYGSDALGGVINVITHDLPSGERGDPLLGGILSAQAYTGNRQGAGELSLEGASGAVGYRARLSGRSAGETRTPAGSLRNSGLSELNGGGLLGVSGEWGALSGDFSAVSQRLEIHEDPAEDPEATPFQRVEHRRAHLHADLPSDAVRFELDASWQRNVRKEFESSPDAVPALHLDLRTATFEARGHHRPFGDLIGTIGLSLSSQKNATLAEEKLIPGYSSYDVAAFVFEELHHGSLTVNAGLRADRRSMDIAATEDLGVAAQERSYGAGSGSVGVSWRFAGAFSLASSVGRGWRAPTPFELFVDGVHEGTVQYLVGDATLGAERSTNFDLSLRYASDAASAELTVFRNVIRDYIYADPTGARDAESGFAVYQLRQADATMRGLEFSCQAHLSPWLIVSAGADIVRGDNGATGRPLPLMPADRLRLGARVMRGTFGPAVNAYLSAGIRLVAAQERVEEFETTTPGYALAELGMGMELGTGAGRMTFDLSAENLFDAGYRDHLSRYKAYAQNPGRTIVMKVALPFVLASR